MAELGLTAEEVVQACNKIIVNAGLVAKVANLEEVRAICSSSLLLVAALEGLLGRQLEGIIRNSKTPVERSCNISVVVDVLSQLLSCDLSHISGERIVEGCMEDITNILELMAVVCQGKPLEGPPSPEHSPGFSVRQPEPQFEGSPTHGHHHPRGALDDQRSSQPRSSSSDMDRGSDRSPNDPSQPSSGDEQGVRWRQQPQQQERTRDKGVPPSDRGQDLGAEGVFPHGVVRVRRKGGGRRQRVSLRRAVVSNPGHVPLSPIQELSREEWENSRATRGTPSLQYPDMSVRVPEVRGPEVTSQPTASSHSPGPDLSALRHSAGGASSVISVPSIARDALLLRRTNTSISGPLSSGSTSPRQRFQSHQHEWDGGSSAAGYGESSATSVVIPPRSPSPTLPSNDPVTTLLGRALSQAEETLRAMGRQYQELYYNENDDVMAHAIRLVRGRRPLGKDRQPKTSHGIGRRRGGAGATIRNIESPVSETTHRVPRTALSSEGPSAGVQIPQYASFLRQARQDLMDRASTVPNRVRSRPFSSSIPGSRLGLQPSSRGAARVPSTEALVQRPVSAGASGRARAGGAGGREQAALVRSLREGSAAATVAASPVQKGRRLMVPHTASSLYGQEVVGGMEQRRNAEALSGLAPHKPQVAMQLNPDLAARLQYLHKIATGDPRQRAARAAVEMQAVVEDMGRSARRRALLERLSSARARRQEAVRLTVDRLREQGLDYRKRMEQLRLQRLATEWAGIQHSAQMRRALQAEVAVRDAFLEVLAREKEVLLAERQDARAIAESAFPDYKRALIKTERDYKEVYSMLHEMLALQQQQCFRADREAQQAQRHYTQLATTVVQDRIQELLSRVAHEEEAAHHRHSIATQPRAKRALVARLRRLLGLTSRTGLGEATA